MKKKASKHPTPRQNRRTKTSKVSDSSNGPKSGSGRKRTNKNLSKGLNSTPSVSTENSRSWLANSFSVGFENLKFEFQEFGSHELENERNHDGRKTMDVQEAINQFSAGPSGFWNILQAYQLEAIQIRDPEPLAQFTFDFLKNQFLKSERACLRVVLGEKINFMAVDCDHQKREGRSFPMHAESVDDNIIVHARRKHLPIIDGNQLNNKRNPPGKHRDTGSIISVPLGEGPRRNEWLFTLSWFTGKWNVPRLANAV